MPASETTRGTADRATDGTATTNVGNPGVLIGTQDVGGQPYARYRATTGTWVSSSLQEQGYAALYPRSSGYGAYTGLVRSSDGTLLTNPDRIRPGQEYLVPVVRGTQPAPGRTEASPSTPEPIAGAGPPRGIDDRYGGSQLLPSSQPKMTAAQLAAQLPVPVGAAALTALAPAPPAEGVEALLLGRLSAIEGIGGIGGLSGRALLAGPKPPPNPLVIAGAAAGAAVIFAIYQWSRVFDQWKSLDQAREEARNQLRHVQEGVRKLWQNGIITDEEYALYQATGTLVVQPEGPRPGETGAQYERRVFLQTPLLPPSKTYHGWRGGTSGRVETWWNSVKGRFGADERARAEQVLAMSTGRFVAKYGSKQLQAKWADRESIRDKIAKELEAARKALSEVPISSKKEHKIASARVEELTKTLDEITSAESREIGKLRPDQIELFFNDARAVITDITLKLHDEWHELKSLVYRDVVRAITGYDAVAIEFKTAQQQVILATDEWTPGSKYSLRAPPTTEESPKLPESDPPDAGFAPSR